MASPPLLRLCIEEVTKPLPLPAWAAKIEVAGRIVATPPSTPPHPKLQHEVVPPWGMEADIVPGRPATGRLGIPRQGGTLAFLEETASKALKAKSSAEACQSVSLRRGDTEAGTMPRHEVVPPWAVEENSSRPATGEELRMLSSEALKRRKQMKDLVPTVNPETMLPAGQASGKASRQNEVPSSVPETETPRPKKSKGDIRWSPFVQKIVALTSARDRTSAAEQEAEKAKLKLKDKNQEIAPCVATTKAQREYGIKDGDPGGLSTERQRRWQNPPREEEIQREVQAALDAQRERTRYERNFEKEEDKYFAAKAAAHALQLEIREAEARATWRTKCEDVQKEVLQQRKELRAGKIQSKQMAEGANSFQIGRDMLSELDALRQSKLRNAMLRAEDLEARRQRKQKEAQSEKEEEQVAAQMMLDHMDAQHAYRRARRQNRLTKQCVKVLRGEQLEKRGGGLPTGRHRPRHRPTSAEFQAQAEKLQIERHKTLMEKTQQQEAEKRQKLLEVMKFAQEQIRQHEEQRQQEVLAQAQERKEMEAEAKNFELQQRTEAEQKRQRHVQMAKQVLQQAEEERERRRLKSR